MKGAYLWITFLLVPAVVFCQDAPDGASKIILTNSLSKDENYRQVGKILLDNDFAIDYADKELGFINTEFFLARYANDPKLRIVVRDGEVVVAGIIRITYIDNSVSYFELENSGLGLRKAFKIMHTLAIKIPHEKIDYGFSQFR